MHQDMFRDKMGHPSSILEVLAGYCHFAVIYRANPEGLPVPQRLKNKRYEKISEELNRLLQESAWKAVIRHPLSGVKE